jgi:hypothetical protein
LTKRLQAFFDASGGTAAMAFYAHSSAFILAASVPRAANWQANFSLKPLRLALEMTD